MPRAVVNDADIPGGKIELEYETFGSPSDPALLLVMGFNAQMIVWPDGFCADLADSGRFVIRFDNRDCGLSTKLDGVEVDIPAVISAAVQQRPDLMPAVPYTLSDMATDAVGLLDHLGIERAHIVGASMGGMIVQTFAIDHPTRCASMTSIMSMTGEPDYGQASAEAMAILLSTPATEREAYIDASEQSMMWHSQKYGDVGEVRAQAARDFDRSFYPEGATRQIAAIYASGSRGDLLPSVTTPTLVIHGRDDTLIGPSGGFRTAELIPGANLLLMSDMGHDLPEQLWPIVVDAIVSHTAAAAQLDTSGAGAN